jgi:hypothetical protein
MFAESTSLHDKAIKALAATDRAMRLLEFEEHLLDRRRPRAGTGGKTIKDLGHGFLGQHDRHVKDRINALLALNRHTCMTDPLEPPLVATALIFGRNHKGMPQWPGVAERIGILLADAAHPAWGGYGQGQQALTEMPQGTQAPDELLIRLPWPWLVSRPAVPVDRAPGQSLQVGVRHPVPLRAGENVRLGDGEHYEGEPLQARTGLQGVVREQLELDPYRRPGVSRQVAAPHLGCVLLGAVGQ